MTSPFAYRSFRLFYRHPGPGLNEGKFGCAKPGFGKAYKEKEKATLRARFERLKGLELGYGIL
jgi:hypothetical protein